MKMETQPTETYGMLQKQSERKVYSHKCIWQEIRKHLNNLTLHFKELETEEMYPKVSRGRDAIKTRVEINKIDKRKSIERINEIKAGFAKR